MDNTKGIGKPPHDTLPLSQGKNYILAIGIDHYDNHRSLKNAVADAKAFVDLMTNRYGFELLNEPLYDKAATQRNIRKALGKCESLGEHDRLIVFYSGHGWFKKASKLGYLVPTEAEDDPNSDFIPVNFVTNIFQSVAAHHILLIVDCCFGGSFGLERNVMVDEKTAKVVAELDKKKSRMVLSSGSIEPVSDGLIRDNNLRNAHFGLVILRGGFINKLPIGHFLSRQLRKRTIGKIVQKLIKIFIMTAIFYSFPFHLCPFLFQQCSNNCFKFTFWKIFDKISQQRNALCFHRCLIRPFFGCFKVCAKQSQFAIGMSKMLQHFILRELLCIPICFFT